MDLVGTQLTRLDDLFHLDHGDTPGSRRQGIEVLGSVTVDDIAVPVGFQPLTMAKSPTTDSSRMQGRPLNSRTSLPSPIGVP